MIYLSGAFRRSQIQEMINLGVGVMLQPRNGYLDVLPDLPCWAADNGCFSQGDSFSLDKFYRWLDRVPLDRCLFATAPDVFSDAVATLARSMPELPELRRRGHRAAFVLQNGAERTGIPWDATDAIFIGATDEWKLGPEARGLVREARRRGKWVHMGRVNSEKRLRYAAMIGCHSADGTYLKFRNRKGRDGMIDIRKWFRQTMLPL